MPYTDRDTAYSLLILSGRKRLDMVDDKVDALERHMNCVRSFERTNHLPLPLNTNAMRKREFMDLKYRARNGCVSTILKGAILVKVRRMLRNTYPPPTAKHVCTLYETWADLNAEQIALRIMMTAESNTVTD